MKTIEEFREYYNQALLPGLQVFEDKRKVIVKKFKLVMILSSACGTAAAVLLFLFFPHPAAIVIPLILTLIAMAIGYSKLTGSFILDFKNKIIEQIVRFLDGSLLYNPLDKIAREQFAASRVYEQRIDRYSGEDKVSGSIGKTRIEFSEVHAEYKTESRDSKGHRKTEWHTIFRGLFFIADFNKEFKGYTAVLPDIAERMLGSLIGQKLQSFTTAFSKRQLIRLEDPEFEKLFAVYADDQIEARYILTPALMRRIMDFSKKNSMGIAMSFINSNVNIAIPKAKDMFEPRIFHTLLDIRMAEEYFLDLEMALSVVDELNLNTRIWTKA